MKNQNPIVLVLAIVGVIALLYGGWSVYQQHEAEVQNRTFFGGPPAPGFSGLNQPSKQPPPQ